MSIGNYAENWCSVKLENSGAYSPLGATITAIDAIIPQADLAKESRVKNLLKLDR